MTDIKQIEGERTIHCDRKRIAAYVCILVLAVIANFTLGKTVADKNYRKIQANNQNWGFKNFNLPASWQDVPSEIKDRKLIVYISNSHAKTGGQVANHLTNYLNAVAPNEFEVIDLSSPGIFTPDMLQRALFSLQYEPDLIIFGISYISLSDRMRLHRQAHSVRSFFNSSIFAELPLGFWFRHYDIGLYTNTLFNQFVELHKFRNDVRNKWEQPLATLLKDITGDKRVYFLEVDENTSWQFPDGYDKNLFQWRLYAAGRARHIEDIKSAVEIVKNNNVAVFGVNLPIHFEKSRFVVDIKDYNLYRKELQEIFGNADQYVDYQDIFPKEFTTYDALHPTMHGARLHALHYAEMILTKFSENENQMADLQKVFENFANNEGQEYSSYLTVNKENPDYSSFARYDLSDLASANALLAGLSSASPGSAKELQYLYKLQLRIRYWSEFDFSMSSISQNMSSAFVSAYRNELKRAVSRVSVFKEKLKNMQNERLVDYPLPELSDDLVLVNQQKLGAINMQIYKSADNVLFAKYTTQDGKIFALGKRDDKAKVHYTRVDLLGDGSFILLQALNSKLVMPSWVTNKEPFVQFGV